MTLYIILIIILSMASGYLSSYLFYRMKFNALHNTLVETQRLVGAIHKRIKQNQKRKWAEGGKH